MFCVLFRDFDKPSTIFSYWLEKNPKQREEVQLSGKYYDKKMISILEGQIQSKL